MQAWARDRAGLFYLCFGLFGLTVVAMGFGVTYAVPMIRRSFVAPWYVHLHGAAALSWVLLHIVQAQLVRIRKAPWHRRFGQSALPLALLIWMTGVATALWAARRDVDQIGSVATSALAGTVTGLGLFLVLVAAAVFTRHRPDWHKRLVLLATIHLLWPAFFRLRHLLPSVPEPEIWLALVLAYAPVLVAALRDRMLYGAVHSVWLIAGPLVVVEQSLEVALFDRGPQRAFGIWLYALLT